MSEKKLMRSTNKVVAGVLGGLAEFFGIDHISAYLFCSIKHFLCWVPRFIIVYHHVALNARV